MNKVIERMMQIGLYQALLKDIRSGADLKRFRELFNLAVLHNDDFADYYIDECNKLCTALIYDSMTQYKETDVKQDDDADMEIITLMKRIITILEERN